MTLATASAAKSRSYLELAQVVLWRSLRFGDLQAYLGNPSGEPSKTNYVYTSAPVQAPRAEARKEGIRAFGIALAAVAFLLIVGNGYMIWRRA